MFAGHFAVAAAVKAKNPDVPLWSLMAATQLLDVLFVPLLLSGVESMEPVGTGHGEVIIHANYTHSLVGTLLLAVLVGGLAWRAWGKRSGVVLGAVVFSHWLLDFLVHRQDMPLLPGAVGHLPMLGLGLWRFSAVSIGLEALLVVVGAFMYARNTLAQGKGRWFLTGASAMAGLLVLSLLSDLAGLG